PSTWMSFRLCSNGWSVGLNASSSFSSGHHSEGIAPFGKKMNAVRKGAPVAVVANLVAAAPVDAKAFRDPSDSKAGNARQAPSPRKKCRRVKPDRCAARISFDPVIEFID